MVEAVELAALEVRDRNEMRFRIPPEALQHLGAELDVVGVDDGGRDEARERQREVVAMAVHHIEVARLLEGPRGAQHLRHPPVPELFVVAIAVRIGRAQLGRGHRVAGREQGDVVPAPHQLLGEQRDELLDRVALPRPDRHRNGRELGDPQPVVHRLLSRRRGPSGRGSALTSCALPDPRRSPE